MGVFLSVAPIATAFPRKHGKQAHGSRPVLITPPPGMRGPWCVIVVAWPVVRGPLSLRRGPRRVVRGAWCVVAGPCLPWIGSRAVARGAWLLARGARRGAGVPMPILESE